MYGSSFMCVTCSPRASINAPIDADVSPLPIEETTPPVTNTNLVRRLTGGSPCRTSPYHALLVRAPLPHMSARPLGIPAREIDSVQRPRSESADNAEADAARFEIERNGMHCRPLGSSRRGSAAGRIQKQTLAQHAEPTGLRHAVEHVEQRADHQRNCAATGVVRRTTSLAEREPRAGNGDAQLLGATQVVFFKIGRAHV